MTKEYQILKLSRDELLTTAGYHKNNAVYQILDHHGAEKVAAGNTAKEQDNH